MCCPISDRLLPLWEVPPWSSPRCFMCFLHDFLSPPAFCCLKFSLTFFTLSQIIHLPSPLSCADTRKVRMSSLPSLCPTRQVLRCFQSCRYYCLPGRYQMKLISTRVEHVASRVPPAVTRFLCEHWCCHRAQLLGETSTLGPHGRPIP